jgi:hypothetical protein
MNWQTHVPNIFGIDLNVTFIRFGKITKDVWTKAEEHVVKIEKEYCKENFIDRSVIEPIIIDFCDDDSDDDAG